MSALPFLIAGTAVIGLGLAAFVAAIWGAGEFTELDRRLPPWAERKGGDRLPQRLPTQADPEAEEDGLWPPANREEDGEGH